MVAIIPARGGSKGLPHKNIKLLNGKPLIQYTIDAALGAECVEHVVVSTDDEEIKEISTKCGAEVPFLRPSYLAEDTSYAEDVYIHAADYLTDYFKYDMRKFIVLLPTCPLRKSYHIDEAMNLFKRSNAQTLISVKKNEKPVTWLLKMNSDGLICNAGFDKHFSSGNRQQNRQYYIPNGAIYILDTDLLKSKRTYYSDNTIGYEMNWLDSVDIDTQEDFLLAEYLLGRQ